MNIVYKVMTKHTRQMLRDFVRFTYRMNHPKATFRFCVLGVGFWVLAPFFKGSMQTRILVSAFGALIIIFAFTRHLIAAAKLEKNDEYYQKQTEITFLFGHAELLVQIGDDKQEIQEMHEIHEIHIKYGEISHAYKDKRNYYLWINNEDVQILPRASFGENEEAYEAFMSQKMGKEIVSLSLPLGKRLTRMNEARKEAERLHDEKIAKKKEERENERANKK